MSAVNAFPLILRATVMTLQTVSWIFSVWVPAVALIAIATIAFTGAADRPRALGVIAGVAVASLALAWLLSRAARWLLGGSRLAAVLLGVALAAGATAIGLWTRTAGDRLQEATRFVWAGVAVCWSVALLLAATRRARDGKLARR